MNNVNFLRNMGANALKDELYDLQDSYDSDIRCLNYATVKCPKCGAVGFFHNHGRYFRYLFNNSDELINVQRVRCEKCLSTHALLSR